MPFVESYQPSHLVQVQQLDLLQVAGPFHPTKGILHQPPIAQPYAVALMPRSSPIDRALTSLDAVLQLGRHQPWRIRVGLAIG